MYDAQSHTALGLGDRLDSQPISNLSTTYPTTNNLFDPQPDIALDAGNLSLWPLSWPECLCLLSTEVAITSLKEAARSHSTVKALRHAAGILEKLLACPSCFNSSRSCFFNIQNVLLISRLMHEVANGFMGYSEWLKECGRKLQDSDKSESVSFVYDKVNAASFDLKFTNRTYRSFILLGLQDDMNHLARISEAFATRQRAGHEQGHQDCSEDGKCLKLQSSLAVDPLEVCPRSKESARLIWCFRSVEEIEITIKKLLNAISE